MDEYRAALSAAKTGAPGTDGIDVPMLKAAPMEVHLHILACMNGILVQGAEIPEAWCRARIVLIPKDGSPTNPTNYQPISLLQVSYKLFTKIITNWLSAVANKYILSSSQLGFQPGMSAQSTLHAMVDIIEDSARHGSKIHVAYIDFWKAFDLVFHTALWETLTHYGLSADLIDLIHRLLATVCLTSTSIPVPVNPSPYSGVCSRETLCHPCSSFLSSTHYLNG